MSEISNGAIFSGDLFTGLTVTPQLAKKTKTVASSNDLIIKLKFKYFFQPPISGFGGIVPCPVTCLTKTGIVISCRPFTARPTSYSPALCICKFGIPTTIAAPADDAPGGICIWICCGGGGGCSSLPSESMIENFISFTPSSIFRNRNLPTIKQLIAMGNCGTNIMSVAPRMLISPCAPGRAAKQSVKISVVIWLKCGCPAIWSTRFLAAHHPRTSKLTIDRCQSRGPMWADRQRH